MIPSTLRAAFLAITAHWRSLFPQQRTWQRGVRQALGSLVCRGRRCLSRVIGTNGGQHRSWSAEYFFYSRSRWDPQHLFRPLLRQARAYGPGRFVGMAVDDTRLRKTGRCIPQAGYHRDPLSPPFHTNLMLGLRFLQTSLLVPLHRIADVAARALPVRFEEVSVVKKPGQRADPAAWTDSRWARNLHNLSTRGVQTMQTLRTCLDEAGGRRRGWVLAVDASFCNRTVLGTPVPGVELIARTRKDAVLCFPASPGGRRVYAAEKFTPEQVRKNASIPWKTTQRFYGGKRRKIRYKEVPGILWQGGAQRRRLRLLVIAPTPYRKRPSARLCYRQPAYLLTSIPQGHAPALLQIYFDRWQIEVNHREEKDTLGVGQAQLWNAISVPK
ncbi:MAG: transposase [Terriglobia bacterium]